MSNSTMNPEMLQYIDNNFDVLWRCLNAILVFAMQIGFVLLETGSVRTLSAASVIFKNIGDLCISGLMFYLVGYGMLYGEGNGFIGYYTTGNSIAAWPVNSGDLSYFFFNVAFAATAVTIVSGCLLERTRTLAYFHFAFWFSLIIYPICGHWAWAPEGFLNNIITDVKFLDFAGSGVVHLVGGTAGLVGAIFVGQRPDFLDPITGKPQRIPGHSLALSSTGGLLLWFGWFSFNCGSQPFSGNSYLISVIGVNTFLSGGTAGFTSILIKLIAVLRGNTDQAFDVDFTMNSILTGLVAVTASCANIDGWAALVSGFFSAIVYHYSSLLILNLHIDDPLNAITVHGSGGLLGLLFAGVFSKTNGVVTGSFALLGVQVVGIVVFILWSGFFSILIFMGIKYTHGLSLNTITTGKQGKINLDYFEFAGQAYPEWEQKDESADLLLLLDSDRAPMLLAFKEYLLENDQALAYALDFLIAVQKFGTETCFSIESGYHVKIYERFIAEYNEKPCPQKIAISKFILSSLKMSLDSPTLHMFDLVSKEVTITLANGPFNVFRSFNYKLKSKLRHTSDGPLDVTYTVDPSSATVNWNFTSTRNSSSSSGSVDDNTFNPVTDSNAELDDKPHDEILIEDNNEEVILAMPQSYINLVPRRFSKMSNSRSLGSAVSSPLAPLDMPYQPPPDNSALKDLHVQLTVIGLELNDLSLQLKCCQDFIPDCNQHINQLDHAHKKFVSDKLGEQQRLLKLEGSVEKLLEYVSSCEIEATKLKSSTENNNNDKLSDEKMDKILSSIKSTAAACRLSASNALQHQLLAKQLLTKTEAAANKAEQALQKTEKSLTLTTSSPYGRPITSNSAYNKGVITTNVNSYTSKLPTASPYGKPNSKPLSGHKSLGNYAMPQKQGNVVIQHSLQYINKCTMLRTITRLNERKPIKIQTDFFGVKESGWTRFVVISDTHGQTNGAMIPKGDVLIHCGDFTNVGEMQDVKHFCEFLDKQTSFKHKIVIAGNHDLVFDSEHYGDLWRKFGHAKPFNPDEAKKLISQHCTYIEDQLIEVEGYSIFGSPWSPEFKNWAFNLKRGESILKKWKEIPEGVDLLLTHGPPKGHGDETDHGLVGCEDLYNEVITRIKPRVHCFGHVHSGYGVTEENDIKFVNASMCNDKYKPIQHAIIFDIPPL